jgi:hypothetical protein
VLLETLEALGNVKARRRYHELAEANLARWREAVSQSIVTDVTDVTDGAPRRACQVRVLPGDWGEVTRCLTEECGVTFASLNMANAYTPSAHSDRTQLLIMRACAVAHVSAICSSRGGGYVEGMVAQEENMLRRTDCHFSLVRDGTHIDAHGRQYTHSASELLNAADGRVFLDTKHPRVCVRGSEERSADDLGYRWYAESEVFPFFELRAAACDLRCKLGKFDGAVRGEMAHRVAAQLDTLIDAGVRHVVLSAFGCGAFLNPADVVAQLYKEALDERAQHFDVVAFAVFHAGYGPNNFAAFEQVLGGKSERSGAASGGA